MEVFYWRLPLRERDFVPCVRVIEKDGKPIIEIGSYEPYDANTGSDFVALSEDEARNLASALSNATTFAMVFKSTGKAPPSRLEPARPGEGDDAGREGWRETQGE